MNSKHTRLDASFLSLVLGELLELALVIVAETA